MEIERGGMRKGISLVHIRLLAVCFSFKISVGVEGRHLHLKGEWDETWAWHTQKQKDSLLGNCHTALDHLTPFSK